MNAKYNDMGALVSANANIKPQSLSGTTAVKGAALDRLGFASGKLIAQVGAPTGTPTSFTATVKLQESDTTTDGDFVDIDGASFVLDADGESNSLDFNLQPRKRYVRAVATPAFVDGTSPTVPLQATILLGGKYTSPV